MCTPLEPLTESQYNALMNAIGEAILYLPQHNVLGNAKPTTTDGSFGTTPTAPNGFSALAALDTNLDGIVNKDNAQFADLRIWRDLNQIAAHSYTSSNLEHTHTRKDSNPLFLRRKISLSTQPR